MWKSVVVRLSCSSVAHGTDDKTGIRRIYEAGVGWTSELSVGTLWTRMCGPRELNSGRRDRRGLSVRRTMYARDRCRGPAAPQRTLASALEVAALRTSRPPHQATISQPGQAATRAVSQPGFVAHNDRSSLSHRSGQPPALCKPPAARSLTPAADALHSRSSTPPRQPLYAYQDGRSPACRSTTRCACSR